jgi:hypothetical protein
MTLCVRSLSLLNGVSGVQPNPLTRDLRFQGHRTLQFDVFDPNAPQDAPIEAKVRAPINTQHMEALHQFAKTLLNCFPNVHLLKNQQGHSAVIVTINPIQKTLDIFYTDLIKHFLPHAIQRAGLELSKSQPAEGSPNLLLESSRMGTHNDLVMPSGLQAQWKNWLATKGVKPQATEPESLISKLEPYAISLNIGSVEPTMQKLQPFLL